MRVRVSYVVEVDDLFRKSLMEFFGKKGMAEWDDVEEFFFLYGTSGNETVRGKFQIREDVSVKSRGRVKKKKKLPKVS